MSDGPREATLTPSRRVMGERPRTRLRRLTRARGKPRPKRRRQPRARNDRRRECLPPRGEQLDRRSERTRVKRLTGSPSDTERQPRTPSSVRRRATDPAIGVASIPATCWQDQCASSSRCCYGPHRGLPRPTRFRRGPVAQGIGSTLPLTSPPLPFGSVAVEPVAPAPAPWAAFGGLGPRPAIRWKRSPGPHGSRDHLLLIRRQRWPIGGRWGRERSPIASRLVVASVAYSRPMPRQWNPRVARGGRRPVAARTVS
jgi:hypothetical protein